MTNSTLPTALDPRTLISDGWIWLDQNTTRILIALAAGAAIVALLYAAKQVGKWLVKAEHPWWGVIGRGLASMRFWFVITAAAQIVALYAHPPTDLAKTIQFLFTVAATFQGAIFLRELALGAVEVRARAADPQGTLPTAVGLIRIAITLGLFFFALVLILSNLGVNVTALVAGLGVGGIAIGLAAQGIFADLFAALVILFDKPFRKGDVIRWEKGGGTVRAIGLKSTRLESTTGEELIVSNTRLLAGELTNISASERRRVTQALLVTYDTPPQTLARIPAIAEEIVNACEDCIFLRCNLETLKDATLEFVLTYDITTHSFAVMSGRKHRINIAILDRFAEEGIGFAAPDGKPLSVVKADDAAA
jgi:small-conductance mechanosensitive channel